MDNMELFDKLGDTIVSVSKDATQKAKDLSEQARIRMEIRSKQDYMNKLFLEIGKVYYDAHKDDEEKEFEEQMILVKDAQEVLEQLKQQLGQIKGTITCVECGQDMPIEADYCSKCGTKLVKPKKEDAEVIFDEEDESGEAVAEEADENSGIVEEISKDSEIAETVEAVEEKSDAESESEPAETVSTEGKDSE